MTRGIRSARFVMLFGFGLFFTLVSFAFFLVNSYSDYTQTVVLLSPGESEPLFFTLDVVIVMIIYSAVLVVLAIALAYSWRGYRALAPTPISRKEHLAELRKKSRFFRKN